MRAGGSRRAFLAAAAGALLTGCGGGARRILLQGRGGGAPTGGPGPQEVGGTGPPADFVCDIHCHTFNARDLPIDGFLRSLVQGMGVPPAADAVLARVTQPFHRAVVAATPETDDDLRAPAMSLEATAALLATLDAPTFARARDPVTYLVATLRLATQSRVALAASIARAYPDVELFTPSLVDFGRWIDRNKRGRVLDAEDPPRLQIQRHAAVVKKAMRGEIVGCRAAFHPFVAFNPWRQLTENGGDPTDLEQIRHALNDLGFVGVKIYPPSGFLPLGNARLTEFKAGRFGERLDDVLRALYDYCQSEDVPILTHASEGNAFFPDSSWRGSPWGWRRALAEFPDLRVCFGHFGHMEGLLGTADALPCVAWAEGFVELMLKHPNVYADVSNSEAASSNPKRRQAYQGRFLHWLCGKLASDDGPRISERLLYGSDWWMGAMSGMDRHFMNEIRAMIEDSMGAVTKRPEHVDFRPRFWGENALRFLGVRQADGSLCSDGTARRLGGLYEREGLARPRWLRA